MGQTLVQVVVTPSCDVWIAFNEPGDHDDRERKYIIERDALIHAVFELDKRRRAAAKEETKMPKPTNYAELIMQLDPLVDATGNSDITGPCHKSVDGKPCVVRESEYRDRKGHALGFLNYRREQMCDPCLLHYLLSAARVQASQMQQDEKALSATRGDHG